MPCYNDDSQDREEQETLANMLCYLCTDLDHRGIRLPRLVSEWWEIHKERDVWKQAFELRRNDSSNEVWRKARDKRNEWEAKENKELERIRKLLGLSE